ncbi:hypothetical protein ACQEV2_43280 [Streptomyces sp. CA-251387]|uniref:hypothetical protein n=1 Tax=Streptomyces sp. CA-251387 TaxID=3240064 RepID=UPI003D8BC302
MAKFVAPFAVLAAGIGMAVPAAAGTPIPGVAENVPVYISIESLNLENVEDGWLDSTAEVYGHLWVQHTTETGAPGIWRIGQCPRGGSEIGYDTETRWISYGDVPWNSTSCSPKRVAGSWPAQNFAATILCRVNYWGNPTWDDVHDFRSEDAARTPCKAPNNRWGFFLDSNEKINLGYYLKDWDQNSSDDTLCDATNAQYEVKAGDLQRGKSTLVTIHSGTGDALCDVTYKITVPQ